MEQINYATLHSVVLYYNFRIVLAKSSKSEALRSSFTSPSPQSHTFGFLIFSSACLVPTRRSSVLSSQLTDYHPSLSDSTLRGSHQFDQMLNKENSIKYVLIISNSYFMIGHGRQSHFTRSILWKTGNHFSLNSKDTSILTINKVVNTGNMVAE